MKEETAGDHLGIGWTTTPEEMASISVIDGSNLVRYQACTTSRSRAELASIPPTPSEGFILRLHPNPASREVSLDLSGFARKAAIEVQMRDRTGKVFKPGQIQLNARNNVEGVSLPVS